MSGDEVLDYLTKFLCWIVGTFTAAIGWVWHLANEAQVSVGQTQRQVDRIKNDVSDVGKTIGLFRDEMREMKSDLCGLHDKCRLEVREDVKRIFDRIDRTKDHGG